jgi:LysR family transcriptional regulator, glycine cleavage system transcriptional activator
MKPLPPLNPLKAFESAGRLLSVSKAAEELHVTPAAVSRQIKALEDFIGSPLFSRTPTGLHLTTVGARYLSDITPVVAALREATNAAMGGSRRRNVLKIRSPATFAVRWLIPRLATFHKAHPDIDVQLATSPAPLNFEREDIDAGIELGHGKWPRTSAQKLVPNVLVPIVAPARKDRPVPRHPEDLADEVLLHSMARPDDWKYWLDAAAVPHINAYRGMKYETSLLSYQAAIEGHGVAVAQKVLVDRELAEGVLVTPFSLALDRGEHTYYFAWPEDRPASLALTVFMDWLQSIVGRST